MGSIVDMSHADSRPFEAVREAGREQLVSLMDRYECPLFNFLMILLRDRDAAQDCAQDAFLRAYEHLQRGRQVNAAWLYRVARNRAIDDLRRRKRIRADLGQIERMADPDTSVLAGPVRQALAQLSPGDRELIYLFDIDGFDAREIGEMLGISRNAVHVRVFRARERFRKVYQSTGETA